MAENKKSFVLYSDQRTLIELLNNEQAGVLLKHIFAYVNDENPICTDQLINIAFEPIKQQFKRDLVKWEKTKEGRSKAGLASAEAKKLNKVQQTLTNVNKVKQSSTKSTVNDNVNVNVNVNDIKDINTFDFKKSCMSLGIELDIINDWLLVRKGKKASNTRTAFDLIKSELTKTTLSANECIKIAVQNSWSGFKSDWLKTLDIPINKISGEDEYMLNVMKQVNANKLL
jgi:hypothetical protein